MTLKAGSVLWTGQRLTRPPFRRRFREAFDDDTKSLLCPLSLMRFSEAFDDDTEGLFGALVRPLMMVLKAYFILPLGGASTTLKALIRSLMAMDLWWLGAFDDQILYLRGILLLFCGWADNFFFINFFIHQLLENMAANIQHFMFLLRHCHLTNGVYRSQTGLFCVWLWVLHT